MFRRMTPQGSHAIAGRSAISADPYRRYVGIQVRSALFALDPHSCTLPAGFHHSQGSVMFPPHNAALKGGAVPRPKVVQPGFPTDAKLRFKGASQCSSGLPQSSVRLLVDGADECGGGDAPTG